MSLHGGGEDGGQKELMQIVELRSAIIIRHGDYVTGYPRRNVHTENETENSGKGNHKHRSTGKESDSTRPSEASTSKLRISVNQPLWRRRGHGRQPCWIAGSRNGGWVGCDRRSSFTWRGPRLCRSWGNNHRKRRGKGWGMARRRHWRH